jgi:hypothetical protein
MTPNERLAHLAALLRTVPIQRFDMTDWHRSGGVQAEPACGFAGCAVGWATQDHLMQAEGLSMVDEFPRFDADGADCADGWESVQVFFKLGSDDAGWLFGGDTYGDNDGKFLEPDEVTPAMVADRIEEFLKSDRRID